MTSYGKKENIHYPYYAYKETNNDKILQKKKNKYSTRLVIKQLFETYYTFNAKICSK